MRRHLDVVHRLLREPCSIDPSTLPRVEGGLFCGGCGRTVVDVSELTLEQARDFRRRARAGSERLCGAYTVDERGRVLLRASPHSSRVIAVAIGVLLAACETSAPSATDGKAHATAPSNHSVAENAPPPVASVATTTPATSATAESLGSVSAGAASAAPAPSAASDCVPGKKPRTVKRAKATKDGQMLAGY